MLIVVVVVVVVVVIVVVNMLLLCSLQEFTAGELTSHEGPLHMQVDDEMKRREQLLNMKQQLAQQVIQKSKDAGLSGCSSTFCIAFCPNYINLSCHISITLSQVAVFEFFISFPITNPTCCNTEGMNEMDCLT